MVTGGTPRTSINTYWGRKYPWITPTDISLNRDMYSSERMITQDGLDVIRSLPPNTVLVTCIASIGKNAILRKLGGCNQQINAVIPNEDHSPEFLYYLFEYNKPYLLANSGITATRIISKADFSKLNFATPLVEEQRTIANALSDVDALLIKLDQLITKKRDLKQAAVQQLLTGKTRLPGFSGEWEVKSMQSLGQTYGGLTGKTKEDFGHGTSCYIPFMNVMTDTVINTEWLEFVDVGATEAQNQVRKGDLFFNGSSETPEEVGFCSVLMEERPNLYLNSFCFGFRFSQDIKINELFFAYWFRSKAGRKAMSILAQGATRYNIAKSAFMKLDITLPCEAEQTAIVTVLGDMDAEISRLEARRNKTRDLKQGMMQELLTGRIRLI
ncbi:MAG: restriction endonuclease subunit S [Burkholderiaceae bacterium]|nr:restriction endonuclease subunit S [Burkholderiaceae bacterium]